MGSAQIRLIKASDIYWQVNYPVKPGGKKSGPRGQAAFRSTRARRIAAATASRPLCRGWMSDNSIVSLNVHKGRYQVLAFLCVCALIAYVQRAALSVPAAEIASDLRFSDVAREMGWIQSAWYLCYALMQLPSGWLADRIGSRRGLAILSVAWSLATLLCAFATDFLSLLLLWSAMGAAQAGVFPCAVKALGQIFPETERARATGLLGSGMTIGGALAPVLAAVFLGSLLPLANALSLDRWRLLLAAYALPGILWMVAFVMLISVRKLPA